jgi:hypothetical protein
LNTNYMKAPNATPKNNAFIKSTLIILVLLFVSLCSRAQDELAFPFKGGSEVMSKFFRDSVALTPDIIQKKATGTVIFKFSADQQGNISKLVIYYADDYSLTPPLIDALKKSGHQWVIPPHEKSHDFVIPFTVYFNLPANPGSQLMNDFYSFYTQRHQILSLNQVPMNDATLLPTMVVTYDVQ